MMIFLLKKKKIMRINLRTKHAGDIGKQENSLAE